MSSGIYVLPGTQTFNNLEQADGHGKIVQSSVEPFPTDPVAINQPNRSDLVGLIPYQLFCSHTSSGTDNSMEVVETLENPDKVGDPREWSSEVHELKSSDVGSNISNVEAPFIECSPAYSKAPSSVPINISTNESNIPLPKKKRDILRSKFESTPLKNTLKADRGEESIEAEVYDGSDMFATKNPKAEHQNSNHHQQFPPTGMARPQTGHTDLYSSTTCKVAPLENSSASWSIDHSNTSSAVRPTSKQTSNSAHGNTTVGGKRTTVQEPAKSSQSVSAANAISRSSYMCRKCRAHGKLLPVKQHKRNCPFRNCTCTVCSLVNYGRHIVAKQIALYRDQKNHHNPSVDGVRKFKHSQTVAEGHVHTLHSMEGPRLYTPERIIANDLVDEDGPHCRRCRNHGKNNPWKGHKKTCPYRYCICQQCILISLRKSNEKNLREVVQEYFEDRGDKRERCASTKYSNRSFFGDSSAATANTKPLPVPGGSVSNYFQAFNGQVPFPSLGLKPAHSLFSHSYLSKLTEAYNHTRMVLAPGFGSTTALLNDEKNSGSVLLANEHTSGARKSDQLFSSVSMKQNRNRPLTYLDQPGGHADVSLRNGKSSACRQSQSKFSVTDMDGRFQPSFLAPQSSFNFDASAFQTDPQHSSFQPKSQDYALYPNYSVKMFDSQSMNGRLVAQPQILHEYTSGETSVPFLTSVVDETYLDQVYQRGCSSGSWLNTSIPVDNCSVPTTSTVFRNLLEGASNNQYAQRPTNLISGSSTQAPSGCSRDSYINNTSIPDLDQFRRWGSVQLREPGHAGALSSTDGHLQQNGSADWGGSLENRDYQTRAAAFAAAAAAAVALHHEVSQQSTKKSDCPSPHKSPAFDMCRTVSHIEASAHADSFNMSNPLCYPPFNSLGFATSLVPSAEVYGSVVGQSLQECEPIANHVAQSDDIDISNRSSDEEVGLKLRAYRETAEHVREHSESVIFRASGHTPISDLTQNWTVTTTTPRSTSLGWTEREIASQQGMQSNTTSGSCQNLPAEIVEKQPCNESEAQFEKACFLESSDSKDCSKLNGVPLINESISVPFSADSASHYRAFAVTSAGLGKTLRAKAILGHKGTNGDNQLAPTGFEEQPNHTNRMQWINTP